MASTTFENAYFGSLLDMAESHLDVHKNQRDRMLDGEQPVIELRGNSIHDDSWQLLIDKAVQQGVVPTNKWSE